MRTIVTKLVALLLLAGCLSGSIHAQQQFHESQVQGLVADLAARGTITAAQQQSYVSGTDTGTANAYAVTLSPAPTIGTFSLVVVKITNANTGASTLAVNGGTATPIKKQGTTALVAGDLSAGQIAAFVYDSTNYQWIGGSGGGGGGSCGSSNIPCTNTANSYTTGNQAISTGAPANVGQIITATNGGVTGWAFVQGLPSPTAGGAPSKSLAFTSSVGSGHAIVVAIVGIAGGATTYAVTDTLGNTFTSVSTPTQTGGYNMNVQVACSSVSGGADTVTVTAASGNVSTVAIHEYSGILASGCFVAEAHLTNFILPNPSVVGPITASTGDLIFTTEFDATNPPVSSATGYTNRELAIESSSGVGEQTADAIATAGSNSASWTSLRGVGLSIVALRVATSSPQTADLSQWKDAFGTVAARVDANEGGHWPTLTLSPTTAATCTSFIAGQFQYTQGNPTTKDVVQVCAHDASNVYAWRSIY